jgi:hypothetical protein
VRCEPIDRGYERQPSDRDGTAGPGMKAARTAFESLEKSKEGKKTTGRRGEEEVYRIWYVRIATPLKW